MQVNRQQLITIIIAMLHDINQVGPERFDDLTAYRNDLEKGRLKSHLLTTLVNWYSSDYDTVPFPTDHLDLVCESLYRFMTDRLRGNVQQRSYDMVSKEDGPLLGDAAIHALIESFPPMEAPQ